MSSLFVLKSHASETQFRSSGLLPLSDWPGTDFPNCDEWWPGDIVLVRAKRNLVGLSITAAQASLPSPEVRLNREWSHVAIYIGDGQIIDCAPQVGVTQRSLWHYCRRRDIAVRRLKDPWTRNNGYWVAEQARRRIGMKYSWPELVATYFHPGRPVHPNRLFCSTFVAYMIAEATGDIIFDETCLHLYPAAIAASRLFAEVPVHWEQGLLADIGDETGHRRSDTSAK